MTKPTDATVDVTPEPCPFCGGHAYEGSKGIGGPGNEHTWTYRLCCHICGAEGPSRPTKTKAIAAWNTRQQAERDTIAGGGALQAARDALEPFAEVADCYDDREDDNFEVWVDAGPERIIRASFKLGLYRKAREVAATLDAALATPAGVEGMREALDRIEATLDAAERTMNASPFWDETSRYAGKALLDYPRSQIAHERAALSTSPDTTGDGLETALDAFLAPDGDVKLAGDQFSRLVAKLDLARGKVAGSFAREGLAALSRQSTPLKDDEV